jgi:hypothetical protein
MIEKYFLNQGQCSMVDCTPPALRFMTISADIDNLGWDCFVEGRILYSLIVSNTCCTWAGGTFFTVVLVCQFLVLAGNRFWFYILMYLEYNTVVVLC